MKLQIVLACVFFLSTVVCAQGDKNCEAAVDAAASMNMNQPECDYSDKGLNGYLKKAFKKNEDGATLETGDNKEVVGKNNIQESENKLGKIKPEKVRAESFLLNTEATQWADISAVRMPLLAKAMEKCGTGFTISEETYRALAGGRLKLTMRFECIID